jgi:Membrane protein involved in colicin uptake
MPYVMVFIRWKNIGKVVRVMGTIWAILALLITIGIISSDGDTADNATPANAEQSVNDKELAANADADAKAKDDKEAKEKAEAEARAKADKEAKDKAESDAKVAADTEAAKSPSWNTSEIYTDKNGNIALAIDMLKAYKGTLPNEDNVYSADVLKAPWNFYGKSVSFSGYVGIAQDYPPGSDFEQQGILSQIVMTTEDGTAIDILLTIPSGNIKPDDFITINAVPVGLFENDNEQGGTSTLVAAVADKLNETNN